MQGKCVVSLKRHRVGMEGINSGQRASPGSAGTVPNIPHREEVVLESEEDAQKVVKGPRWTPEDLCPTCVSEQEDKRECVNTGVTQ